MRLLRLDWLFLAAIILLILVGLTALYSISFSDSELDSGYLVKQLISLGIGIALMLFLSFYDYRIFSSNSTKLYFVLLGLLLLVFFFGTTVNGTTGWFGFKGFHIQPVEIAKLVMIIFLASFFSKKRTEFGTFSRIFVSMVLLVVPVFLILKQPDFGSAFIIIGIWGVMVLVSGLSKKNIFFFLFFAILVVISSWFFLQGYQKERIINFMDPFNDPRGSGYNVIQSMVAVGSGGMLGKGLGHGSQSQLNFLPEKHTDFIFAVIGEELGLIGISAVLVLYVFLFYRLKEVARLSRDNFGYLLVMGIITMIFLQFFINAGMNIGLAPVAGVPLPFLSYGGSSLVSVLASIGIAQSVFMRRIRSLD